MQVAICGAGIGGLSCAIALRAQGIQVDIYESAPSLAPLGAGITLGFNAMQVMRHVGLDFAIARQGCRLVGGTISDHQIRTLTQSSFDELEAEFGVPFVGITRGKLQEILLSAFPSERIHLSKTLQKYEAGDSGASAHFSDGTSCKVELLICADGIRSAARRQMFPQVQPRYAGQTSWRGMLSSQGVDFEPAQALEAWGRGTRFGALPVGPATLYWFAVAPSPSGRKIEREARHKSDVMDLLAPYHPKLKAMVEATPEEAILRTDIWYLPALPTWSQGRVVLLGDAAHATTPNLGQGAAQAMEDAYCLASCLAKFEPETALGGYWKRRHEKAQWVVDTSRRVGWLGAWTHPLTIRLRNSLLRMTPPAQALKTMRRIGRLDWLDETAASPS